MFQLDSLSCDIVWPMDTYMRLSLWSSMVRCSSFFWINSKWSHCQNYFVSIYIRLIRMNNKGKDEIGLIFLVKFNSIQSCNQITWKFSGASSWETEFKFIRMEIKALKITFSRKNNFNFNSKNLNIRRNSNEFFFKC